MPSTQKSGAKMQPCLSQRSLSYALLLFSTIPSHYVISLATEVVEYLRCSHQVPNITSLNEVNDRIVCFTRHWICQHIDVLLIFCVHHHHCFLVGSLARARAIEPFQRVLDLQWFPEYFHRWYQNWTCILDLTFQLIGRINREGGKK